MALVTEFMEDMSLDTALEAHMEGAFLPADLTVYEGINRMSVAAFRDTCFPELHFFDGDASTIMQRYPGPSLAAVVDAISVSQRNELRSWARSPHSQLLWVDGCLGTGLSDWTSDLALEVIGSASIRSYEDGITQTTPVLYHFCSPQIDDVERTPHSVLQDLIFQLIAAHAAQFTQAACRKHRLTLGAFRGAARTGPLHDLLTVFSKCLYVSQAASVLVVIDSLDVLSAQPGTSDSGGHIAAIRQLMDALVKMSHTDAVTIKIMITTRTSISPTIFSPESLAPPRQVLLPVPVPPNRKRPSVRLPRRLRASIHGKPLQTSSKDFPQVILEDSEEESQGGAKEDVHLSAMRGRGPVEINRFEDTNSGAELDFPDSDPYGLELSDDSDDSLEQHRGREAVKRVEITTGDGGSRTEDGIGTKQGLGNDSAAGRELQMWPKGEDTDDSLSYPDEKREMLERELMGSFSSGSDSDELGLGLEESPDSDSDELVLGLGGSGGRGMARYL